MLQRNLIVSEGLVVTGDGLGSAAAWWHPVCDDRKPACQQVKSCTQMTWNA